MSAWVNESVWSGKRVIVTGHTGFKGTWLCWWLKRLGAEVTGLALEPATEPSLYMLTDLAGHLDSNIGDILDQAKVDQLMQQVDPHVVFHLAAQSLVRASYDDPVGTFSTNVVGTATLLNAARSADSLRAFLSVTSDKCYENKEWVWGYREKDAMGGHAAYPASKGCAELVTAAMRRSSFSSDSSNRDCLIASARAGNVIGGGDWASDRLIPGIISAFANSEPVVIRRPHSIRPWQHVLEPLGGYLLLAERLMAGERSFADGWNFGPAADDAKPVQWLVDYMVEHWDGAASYKILQDGPHEALSLRLDCSKASSLLGWKPKMRLQEAMGWTLDWYRGYLNGDDMRDFTLKQIDQYRDFS